MVRWAWKKSPSRFPPYTVASAVSSPVYDAIMAEFRLASEGLVKETEGILDHGKQKRFKDRWNRGDRMQLTIHTEEKIALSNLADVGNEWR